MANNVATSEQFDLAAPWQIVHELRLKLARERHVRVENESINQSLASQLNDSHQRAQHLSDVYHRGELLSQHDRQALAALKETLAREQRVRATGEVEIESLDEVLQTTEASRLQTERNLARAWNTTDVLAKFFTTYQLTHNGSAQNEGQERIDIATLLIEKETLKNERDDLKETVIQERQGRKIQVDGLNNSLAQRQAEISQLQQRLEMNQNQFRLQQVHHKREAQDLFARQHQGPTSLQAHNQEQLVSYERQAQYLQRAEHHI